MVSNVAWTPRRRTKKEKAKSLQDIRGEVERARGAALEVAEQRGPISGVVGVMTL